MATAANSMALAAQARRSYVEGLLNGLPSVVHAVDTGSFLDNTLALGEDGRGAWRADVVITP